MAPPDFFENAPFSIQVVDLEGRTVAVNRAWKALWDLPEAFFQGHIVSGEYSLRTDSLLKANGLLPYVERAFAGEVTVIPPFLYDPSQAGFPGPRRWVGATLHPQRDGEGRQTGVVLLHSDMTREYLSEQRLEAALETGRVAWWELDLSTHQVRRSANHDRLYGHREPLGAWSFEAFLAHLHPEDAPEVQSQFSRMLSEGGMDFYAGEFRVRWKDGSNRWLASRAKLVRDFDARPVALRGTLVDISELKEAIRARDQFLSMASHELKTPLTTLRLQTELFKRKHVTAPPTLDDSRGLLRKLDVQIERIAHLVDDMLDISRIATGKLTLSPERLELSALAEQVVENMRPELAEAGCPLQVELEKGLWGDWDRFRLEQVLVNLLTNASRYAPGARVTVRASREGDHAVLTVQDEGPGIPLADQARIFQPFERLGAPGSGKGLGLGLSIVEEIVEMHRGTVSVTSEPGRGATFRTVLPLSS